MKRILLFLVSSFAFSLLLACEKEPFPLKQLGSPAAFTLTDTEGQPYNYEPTSGTVRLVFFGYTQCPDYCPATMSKLQKVFEKLPFPAEERPEILFISVDPERDTPEVLSRYLEAFKIPATGLTGDRKSLEEIARNFGTFFHIEKKGKDVIVDHSTYLYLIDPEGRIRYLFRSQDSADTIFEGVTALYAEMD
ncbi:SCO family protein [Leptonema illini]|jgi:protein SCO1/2|uniref:Electron transport protein SCO1/SenC n=1 Tax=Leptonema illini DSM 21528 TaxID=929563 RepID=H2CER1_9LEPT|nr:SCO family protein [Leptonema illini]EHQ06673.1 electron transport protein SCO1/SenC [Leptonema illini DSM 21528]